MSAAIIIPPKPSNSAPRKRFTRAEVQQMTDANLFVDHKLELIEGDLIEKTGQKPPHAYAVRMIQVLLAALFGVERIQVQLPIEVCEADQESSLPEPDLAVLNEAKADYQTRYPRGKELLLVVEVADTTVQHDLTTKRDLYLRAGVSEYWVLDLKRRCLVVHRQPTETKFATVLKLLEGESASVESAKSSISVARMLPDPLKNIDRNIFEKGP
jgi:Uma2 family endonuclease